MSLRLPVLAALLAVPVLAVPASSAEAAPASLSTRYSCQSSFGGGVSKVAIGVDLPASTKAGSQVPGRPVTFAVTVPKKMVEAMRQYGVEALSGRSGDASLRVGAKKVSLKKVVLPKTKVPASGAMVLDGSGRAAAFTLTKAGTYAVRVPSSFTATVTAYTSSSSGSIDLDCSLVKGAATTIGSITVR